MFSVSLSRSVRVRSLRAAACAGLGLAGLGLTVLSPVADAAEVWPSHVTATYKVAFNGFEPLRVEIANPDAATSITPA